MFLETLFLRKPTSYFHWKAVSDTWGLYRNSTQAKCRLRIKLGTLDLELIPTAPPSCIYNILKELLLLVGGFLSFFDFLTVLNWRELVVSDAELLACGVMVISDFSHINTYNNWKQILKAVNKKKTLIYSSCGYLDKSGNRKVATVGGKQSVS